MNGILIMNKPDGFTSHDVVAKLRGILHTRKIGHGGTLDPMATGVLPVFLGGATKAADYAAAQDKEYVAGFQLGLATDTQDTTGVTLQTADKRISEAELRAVLADFVGAVQQIPPMYSAVKVGGKKLVDLARKGVEIERPSREIFVRELELLEFDEQTQSGRLRTVVSKGTYVRTLIHDFGAAAGTLAAMSSLVRTRSGRYGLDKAYDFTAVEQAMAEERIDDLLLPTDSLFLDYPAVTLKKEGYDRQINGAPMFERQTSGFPQEKGALCRVYYQDEFLMLGRVDELDVGGLALFVHKRFL